MAAQGSKGHVPSKRENEKERTHAPGRNFITFSNLASEITQHHFCHALFFRTESLRLDHAQGEKNYTPSFFFYGKRVKDFVNVLENHHSKYGNREQEYSLRDIKGKGQSNVMTESMREG